MEQQLWQGIAEGLVPERSERYKQFQAIYFDDPAGFIRDCIWWQASRGPTAYQNEVIGWIPEHKRVSARGPHGLGKTAMAAWIILWFSLTRDGRDWKVVTTAGAWRQLSKYLWPEVHKWARLLKWEFIGRDQFVEGKELLYLSLKLDTGEAFSVASDQPELIEGAHADHLLYVFDESKSIRAATFDAAEGAFSGAGEDTEQDAYAIAFSTPGEPAGRFYEIHKRTPGLEDWQVRHVTLDDAITAGRISSTWAINRKRQWGEESAVYQNRVQGEFASQEEDAVIPLRWVEAAVERWRAWDDAGRPGDLTHLGVDVARSGQDKTVIAHRWDTVVAQLDRYQYNTTMKTAGFIVAILRGATPFVKTVIDVIGHGAGVVDRLQELYQDNRLEREPIAFNAGGKSFKTDKSGELGFRNLRAEMWWSMRERLDPEDGDDLALPPDDKLIGDLVAPKWDITSTGKIFIEEKDQIKKRIGRSTDDGDAVCMAFCESGSVPLVVPMGTTQTSKWMNVTGGQ